MILELASQIWRDMRKHKIRSALAMFGITWGTFTVVVLLALGQSFYTANQKNMLDLSAGTLVVSPGITSMPFQGLTAGRTIIIKASEVMSFKQALPEIDLISPQLREFKNLQRGKIHINASVIGIAPAYAELTKKKVLPNGRYINELDVQHNSTVIFIGADVKDKLFATENAEGKTVYLNDVPFTVIGVEQKKASTGDWYNNQVFIPYSTAVRLWGDNTISGLLIKARHAQNSERLQMQFLDYLGGRYHFDPKDESAINIFDFTKVTQFFLWFFRSMQLFLGLCGVLTLAVGGIGIANIMYLIVLERTSEIGLRMALGATDWHILLQFLLEAGIIVAAGSIGGFLLALITIIILQFIPLPHWLGVPQLSWWILLVTSFILSMIGLLAGFFPARRAAKMNPVQALAF